MNISLVITSKVVCFFPGKYYFRRSFFRPSWGSSFKVYFPMRLSRLKEFAERYYTDPMKNVYRVKKQLFVRRAHAAAQYENHDKVNKV